ncbi:exported hypothetical protein [Candidatus Sulfopaludibacter sp. SbA3]|nr:exported hypothetical protein [Candidatus Sulfopaludibacter sp. SbA3]
MKTRRALVTGGAGFLGSHLCDGLLGEGYAVFWDRICAMGCWARAMRLWQRTIC